MDCSICGKNLERLGQFGGLFPASASIGGFGPTTDFNMWRAQVCTSCSLIFCENCLDLGRPTPCPQCGTPTQPAFQATVNAMGKIKGQLASKNFYGYSVEEAMLKAEQGIKELNIPKEKIIELKVSRLPKLQVSTIWKESIATAKEAALKEIKSKQSFIESGPQKGALTEDSAYDVSEPVVIKTGFWDNKCVEISYKLPALVQLLYRT